VSDFLKKGVKPYLMAPILLTTSINYHPKVTNNKMENTHKETFLVLVQKLYNHGLPFQAFEF
jgi:hypothetical protein